MFKKSTYFKLVFLCLFSFLFLTLENVNAADSLVPCGTGANDPCTLCHFIIGIKGLIDWGMGILITLSLTAISISGVIYIISSGNPELTKKAKNFATSTVIGFSLLLSAWLIINVTLWLFAAKDDLGLEGKNWHTFTCSTTSTSVGGLPPTTDPKIEGYDCDKLTFQTSNIENQCSANDASVALQSLIVCMRNKLGTKMTINSISDSAGLNHCANSYDSKCAHSKSSCHYGGAAKSGKSEAIDISTTTGLTSGNIITAANECQAGYSLDESKKNHVHVSTSACKNN